MATPKRVLFLDGIGCNPEGFKPKFIAGLGYQVVAPFLPDLDFPASVAIANHAIAESPPDVIVGYSRGASVALMLMNRQIPRILIAPALFWATNDCGGEGRIVILHSATDPGLPLEDVRDELARCGLAAADLRIVGEDHSMISLEALSALTEALREICP